jgi:glycosidase
MSSSHGRLGVLRKSRLTALVAAGMLFGSTLMGGVLPALPRVLASAPVSAATTSVALVGDLQSELGCPVDWAPDCAATALTQGPNGVWARSFTVPAGDWLWKIALNGTWTESYGLLSKSGGDNISLHVPAGGVTVKFYFDDKTKWLADSAGSAGAVIATVPGTFDSELGCPGDWQPDCLVTLMSDKDNNGTYTFTTTGIPAGSYEAKIAIGESWSESYGEGGVPGGANVPFTVPGRGYTVTFSYVASTHIPSITVQSGAPSHDNNIEWAGLGHDSQDLVYRQPFGAVNPGTPVTIRFRTFHDDVTGVKARLYDSATSHETVRKMTLEASDVTCFDAALENHANCDWWTTTVTPSRLTTLYYRFIVTDGTATAYYADDKYMNGGWGQTTSSMVDNSYAVTVFDPSFQPIPWMENAVIYQIFPDRFADGRKNNAASTTDPRYGYPTSALDQVTTPSWTTPPEGGCASYVDPATPCTTSSRGRDYYGGDLKGIDQHLDYLKNLGVTVLYLNPVFSAASNHSYDTRNYLQIDPRFGTAQDWDNLQKHAAQRGMRIILDGVFNHVSSDSPYFDRYHHFPAVGACESTSSPYRSWFTFTPLPNGPCAGPGGPNTMTYDAWFGFDSLPILNKAAPAVQDLVYAGSNSVARTWLRAGASGWRLDVMNDGSFPATFWPQFRAAVKATKADAPIIGELWKKADVLPMIHGDQADTTMDYRFRDAMLGFFGTVDNKGFPDDGESNQPPSLLATQLMSLREDYPDATYYTLMNLLDSHDTERILWSLTPGKANPTDRELNAANVATGKQLLELTTLVQMTVPGAPTIYYGDEVGMTGATDPDDRRTFQWAGSDPSNGTTPAGDLTLMAWYQRLTAARASTAALRLGDLHVLLTDDANRTLAYGRELGNQAAVVAVNRNPAGAQTLNIPLGGYLRDGAVLRDVISGSTYTTSAGKLTISLPALGGALLVSNAGQDLTGPVAPTGLTATAGNGQVALAWTAAAGAAWYQVLRSPLSGGGYTAIATVSGTSATDSAVTNGQRYFFVVRSVDALGNVGAQSAEASATPAFTISWANVQWPPTLTVTLGQQTDTIYGQVWAPGITDVGGPTGAILAQVGYGTGTPSAFTGWTPMVFNTRSGNNYEYMAKLLPTSVGTFAYNTRYSTDGGLAWTYAGLTGPDTTGGVLTVNPSSDTTPPTAPTHLAVTDWGASFISLGWTAATDNVAVRWYRIERMPDGGAWSAIDQIDAPATSYDDLTVEAGTTYSYRVVAIDTSLNESPASNVVTQTAAPKMVHVTFQVKVPAETTGVIHITGDQPNLGPWNPGLIPMAQDAGDPTI